MDGSRSVGARFDRSYRPDAWIKLCGLSTGCTIDPPPHPWRGRGVYRALVAFRTRIAAEHGYRSLQTDASDQSRPILRRL